jgi:predicted  nucleic acid-binding Zn-ribbon protein
MYGRALEQDSKQSEKVDASIRSIREGRFLKALVREESRQDETWVIRLRTLPDEPETYYLMELMASHDFQTALHNYLDLEDLHSRTITWKTSLDAFDDIIKLRGQNYQPLLPGVDAKFQELDSRIHARLEQRKHLAERLKTMLTSPRPEYLATAEERTALDRLARIEKQLGDSDNAAVRERVAHLRGLLTWKLETEYPARLTAAYTHLNELNSDVDALTKQYESFVRTRQAATHSYVGYDVQISRLRQRVSEAQQRVETLMARQGHMIETVAIDQLVARRERLVDQQNQARYGVADSYDRAARSQSGEEGQ